MRQIDAFRSRKVNMKELTFEQLEQVSGGDAWGAAAIGLTIVGGAIAVMAAPAVGAAVGLCAMGAGAANAMSAFSSGGGRTRKAGSDDSEYFMVIV